MHEVLKRFNLNNQNFKSLFIFTSCFSNVLNRIQYFHFYSNNKEEALHNFWSNLHGIKEPQC